MLLEVLQRVVDFRCRERDLHRAPKIWSEPLTYVEYSVLTVQAPKSKLLVRVATLIQ